MENELTLNSRQLQAKKTRQKIYSTARSLFQTVGYENVSIADICKGAGISMGNFYHYFKNKNEILNEGFFILADKIHKETAGLNLPPLEYIFFLLRIYGEAIENAGYRLEAAFIQHEVISQIPYSNNPDRPVFDSISLQLERAVAEGYLVNCDTRILYTDIVRVMKGVLYDWIVQKGAFAHTEEIIRMVRELLAPHQARP